MSAIMTDRSIVNSNWWREGQQRGNADDNDAFVMFTFMLFITFHTKKVLSVAAQDEVLERNSKNITEHILLGVRFLNFTPNFFVYV
jgi:hypothetical protein